MVIGTRRTAGRARGVVTVFSLLGVAVIVFVLVFRGMVAYPHPEPTVISEPLAYVGGRLATAGGHLEHIGRIPVVTLKGSPAQSGFAHGRLLSQGVHQFMEHGRAIVASTTAKSGWLGSRFTDQRLRWRYRLLDDSIPGHHLVELSSLARGAKRQDDYETLVRSQAVVDFGGAGRASAGFDLHLLQRTLSIVVPLRGAKGDRIAVARLVATHGSPQPPSVVFVVHGDGALPFVSLAPPGQVGVTTGVNAAGISIIVHPGRTADVNLSNRGIPATLLARSVLESAKSLDEAVAMIKKTKVLASASFLVVDGKTRTHTVVERSPRRSHVDANIKVIDSVLRGKPFIEDPENDRARRADAADRRRDRAKALVREVSADGIEALARLLRDRRNSDQTLLPTGHRATVDDPFADVATIIDPSTMVMWVAEGQGTSGQMRAIDLRYRLGITDRPAPPPDIPAATFAEQSETLRLLEARTHLESALAFAADGRRKAASEAAEAAVTRAPSWPLARRVAGLLAQRAGYRQRSIDHYRLYMKSADSARAEEQINAVLDSH